MIQSKIKTYELCFYLLIMHKINFNVKKLISYEL